MTSDPVEDRADQWEDGVAWAVLRVQWEPGEEPEVGKVRSIFWSRGQLGAKESRLWP